MNKASQPRIPVSHVYAPLGRRATPQFDGTNGSRAQQTADGFWMHADLTGSFFGG
jgi:hypothetical protein